MNKNKQTLIGVFSTLSLFIILFIQINWIVKTAKIKEELFNEKANMVLVRTADALSADKETCKRIDTKIEQKEIDKINNLIKQYMQFYNLTLTYSFDVIKPNPFKLNNEKVFEANVYNKRLNEMVSANGLELHIVFPQKKQFIYEEMSVSFISSIVLIILVLFLFWQTLLSLKRDKKILEHTTEFINNMTHEFKTPIANIALATKMLNKEETVLDKNKIKVYSKIIDEENHRLKQGVDHVLNLSAFEQNQLSQHHQMVDLHDLIKEIAASMQLQVENKKGSIQLNLNAAQYSVKGDRVQLSSVFMNLIDNAIKYCKQEPQVKISTFNSDALLMIEVQDNGIGIEPMYQKKVFEKYFRVPLGNLHTVKGFGLGLAIIKKIMDLHHGSISIKSNAEKGSSFTLKLQYV